MGLSFDEKKSLEEVTGSLHFASYGQASGRQGPNSNSETGNISSFQEWRDNEFDGSGDIQAIGSDGSTVQSNQIM